MLINSSYCGEVEQNGPLVGSIPVEASPSLTFRHAQLTAVTTTTVDEQTVAFLGASNGHLKKVSRLALFVCFENTQSQTQMSCKLSEI